MARPRKPTAALIAQGTFRPDRHAGTEPQPRAGTIRPPKHLNAVAAAEFKRLAAELRAAGVLTLVDRDTLATYCATYARWVEAEGKLAEVGLLTKTPAGFVCANPYLSIVHKCIATMKVLAEQLGITPSARAKLRTPPKVETQEDPRLRFFAPDKGRKQA